MRWLFVIALSACAAPRPLEVRDEGAPRGRAVASATAGASTPVDSATVPAPPATSAPPPSAPEASKPEEPGLPADASELTRADADFRAKRTAEAAGLFINAFMAAKQSERTTGVKQSLDDAITVELEQMAEMEAGWLSQVGLEGYCQRTIELRQLPASAANKTKIAAESKRFCSKLKKQ
jgi:hypothetical protein